MRKEVQKWQTTPDGKTIADEDKQGKSPSVQASGSEGGRDRTTSVDSIPLLDQQQSATGLQASTENSEGLKQR